MSGRFRRRTRCGTAPTASRCCLSRMLASTHGQPTSRKAPEHFAIRGRPSSSSRHMPRRCAGTLMSWPCCPQTSSDRSASTCPRAPTTIRERHHHCSEPMSGRFRRRTRCGTAPTVSRRCLSRMIASTHGQPTSREQPCTSSTSRLQWPLAGGRRLDFATVASATTMEPKCLR